MPRTAATSCGARWWRTASSRASCAARGWCRRPPARPGGRVRCGDAGGSRRGWGWWGVAAGVGVAVVERPAAWLLGRFCLASASPAQAGPAGQRVEPGPAVARGSGGAVASALGERGRRPGRRSRRRGRPEHGQAVREQAVQIRVVRGVSARVDAAQAAAAAAAPAPSPRRVTRFPVRPVCAGRAGRGFRTAPPSLGDRRGYGWRELARWAPLTRTGETIPHKGTGSCSSVAGAGCGSSFRGACGACAGWVGVRVARCVRCVGRGRAGGVRPRNGAESVGHGSGLC